MRKHMLHLFFILTPLMAVSSLSYGHCQIPCGIFDDHARVEAMLEDVVTARKAVKEMGALAGKNDPQSMNQFVRWVINKEEHAQKIISTVSDYFLAQRVKSSQEDYAERLQKHHAVIVAAMKVKQNTDSKHLDALEDSIRQLVAYYPEHKHDEKK